LDQPVAAGGDGVDAIALLAQVAHAAEHLGGREAELSRDGVPGDVLREGLRQEGEHELLAAAAIHGPRSLPEAGLPPACRSSSSEMSPAWAWCVSAPTLTKSAPVAASRGRRSSVIPPDTSTFARPPMARTQSAT